MPGTVFICTRGRRRRDACEVCGDREHELLCDGKDVGSKDTCDRKLCPRCALHAGDKDFCPTHRHQARLQRAFKFTTTETRR